VPFQSAHSVARSKLIASKGGCDPAAPPSGILQEIIGGRPKRGEAVRTISTAADEPVSNFYARCAMRTIAAGSPL
jgi:hypothetical protein